MAQSVELLLDAAADAEVRQQWQSLGDAGVTSLAGHRSPSNRPHVTLAVSRQPWPPDVEAALAATAATAALPVPVRLGGLVVFGRGPGYVLARLVVPSSALLDLHARLAAALPAGPAAGPVPHLAPGCWTPHVTLVRSLRAANFPVALAALGTAPEEVSGAGVAVRRWDGDARREWPVAP